MHTSEQVIVFNVFNDRGPMRPVVHLQARTKRGLRRKVKRFWRLMDKVTRPFPQYDYSQHAHAPVSTWDSAEWPGHGALLVAKKRARMKLNLSRSTNNLLSALDEADRRGWL